MPDVLPFKSAKSMADEALAQALNELVEYAHSGEIQRMVCVCIGDGERIYKVVHRPGDLSLVGALSIVLDDLKATCWQSGPCLE